MPQGQKDGSSIRNLALSRRRRVSREPNQMMDVESKSALRSAEEDSFIFSFWLGVSLLLQGQPCPPCVVGGFKQLLNNVLESQDLLGFIECCSALRSELITRGQWDSALFKGLTTRWSRSLVAALDKAVPGDLCVHPSSHFNRLATFLGWLKRLPVCIRDTSDSVKEYYKNDRNLSSISFENNLYVEDLCEIWREWFGSFRITAPFSPRHGSGSTADCGRIRSNKWANLSCDRRSDVCLRYANLEKVLDYPITSMSRCSKVVFVPKQAGKDRTICMEPAWLQFLQQGVASQLLAFTHGRHPLRRLVNVYSQDVNRYLCSIAQVSGLATIDLTDASDSVSWRLIRKLTYRLPLLRYLYATKSDTVLIDGTVSSFDKFAPMGSALCFPIECYVFASVVELAYRMHYGQASDGHLSGCSVYGDDIICPQEIYHLVFDILQNLGFTVNSKKSYSSGNYFESCGVEYLNGVLIQKVRHPRAHIGLADTVSPEHVGLITDLANSLLSCGYTDARRILLEEYSKKYVRVGRHRIPFMELMIFDTEHCIPIIDNYATKHWRNDIQRSVHNIKTVEPTNERTQYDYQQWRHTIEPRRSADHLLSCDEKWSVKGITALCRFRHWDLLENGEITAASSQRTGRMHYHIRKKFLL